MSKLKDVGLIRVLLLVAALVAANAFVAWNSSQLEAQGGLCDASEVCEISNSKCVYPEPNSQNFCDYYPDFGCSTSDCTDTALEP